MHSRTAGTLDTILSAAAARESCAVSVDRPNQAHDRNSATTVFAMDEDDDGEVFSEDDDEDFDDDDFDDDFDDDEFLEDEEELDEGLVFADDDDDY